MSMPRTAAAAALACLCLAASARAQPEQSGVLQELNLARTDPAGYARILEGEAYASRSAYSTFAYENRGDFDEAIEFLLAQRPLPPLRADPRLDAAAQAFASAQGRAGGFGHVGGDGSSLSERQHRQGLWAGMAAEDISYGYRRPRDVVRQLIVDSGVPSRGHRNNIFEAAYQLAGVGCGPHQRYGAMCVIDFAGAVMRR